MDVLGIQPFQHSPEFERMYSIRIQADHVRILHQLGKFGDRDRKYLTPRMNHGHRTVGSANQVGCTIRYDVRVRWRSFSVVLKKVVAGRYLLCSQISLILAAPASHTARVSWK